MGTDKKDVKYELTPEMKEKLDAVKNHYVKNYTEEEKRFKNKNEHTTIYRP